MIVDLTPGRPFAKPNAKAARKGIRRFPWRRTLGVV